MKRSTVIGLSLLLATTSCMGVRDNARGTTVNTSSFNILGYQFPHHDYDAAWAEVPQGANVVSATASNNDWTSVRGVLTRILGFSFSQVTYTK